MGAAARRRVVDKVAAAVMLQAWLDHRAGRRGTPRVTEPQERAPQERAQRSSARRSAGPARHAGPAPPGGRRRLRPAAHRPPTVAAAAGRWPGWCWAWARSWWWRRCCGPPARSTRPVEPGDLVAEVVVPSGSATDSIATLLGGRGRHHQRPAVPLLRGLEGRRAVEGRRVRRVPRELVVRRGDRGARRRAGPGAGQRSVRITEGKRLDRRARCRSSEQMPTPDRRAAAGRRSDSGEVTLEVQAGRRSPTGRGCSSPTPTSSTTTPPPGRSCRRWPPRWRRCSTSSATTRPRRSRVAPPTS